MLTFQELHEKWEARRAEVKARQEAERAERERKEREEAERRAAEEARRKAEEERLRQEQAEAEGEGKGEEAGGKEEGKEAEEGKEGQEEGMENEQEEEESAPAEAEAKVSDSIEIKPSAEDLSLDTAPEEEELSLDTDMPPNTPETDEFKNLRTNFDRDFPQLLSVLKGTNNIDPIMVSVEKEMEALNKEVIKRIEGTFRKVAYEILRFPGFYVFKEILILLSSSFSARP